MHRSSAAAWGFDAHPGQTFVCPFFKHNVSQCYDVPILLPNSNLPTMNLQKNTFLSVPEYSDSHNSQSSAELGDRWRCMKYAVMIYF